jgi:hypothetical protein
MERDAMDPEKILPQSIPKMFFGLIAEKQPQKW